MNEALANLAADGAAGPGRGGRPAAAGGDGAGRLAWPPATRRSRPMRMAFVYVPNGVHMADWTPEAERRRLRPARHPRAAAGGQGRAAGPERPDPGQGRPNGDGPGDHARALASFLTGRQARKTHGADIRVGVSVDQVAARKVGQQTRFPSLEIGCERGAKAGNCDSGYSCAYSSNISWRTDTTPLAKEIDPKLVFERLFGGGTAGRDARPSARRTSKSILDFVREDASDLQAQAGRQRSPQARRVPDRGPRARAAHRARPASDPASRCPNYPRPTGIPADYAEHIRLMGDLLVLAFQADLTRVATFVFANEGSNRSYPFIGVPEGHHDLSHHGGNAEKQAKIREINRFHITQFAYLLDKLKAIPRGRRHAAGQLHDRLRQRHRRRQRPQPRRPADPAGRQRRRHASSTGRHVRYAKETPLNNLYLSMLDRMERPSKRSATAPGGSNGSREPDGQRRTADGHRSTCRLGLRWLPCCLCSLHRVARAAAGAATAGQRR